jgi:hypothetical protein
MTEKNRDISFGPTEFKSTMDQHALDIKRDGVIIGSLQWHSGRFARVVFNTEGPLLELPVNLLEDIVKKSHEVKK